MLAYAAVSIVPAAQPTTATVFSRPQPFWDAFARYDGGWYYQIARYGYLFVPGGPAVGVGKPGKIAYFPVYPLLMRGAAQLLGGQSAAAYYLGGIVISWVAFVCAMFALYELARLDVDAASARRATILAAIFPFSFFFGVVYTESVFLLFTLVAFYAFRTRQWVLGGLFGALATATRVNGILMAPALAWIAVRRARPTARDRLAAAAALAGVAVGIAAYSAYVYSISGNPFEWAASIGRWNYHPGGAPWSAPLELITKLGTNPIGYFRNEPMAPYDTLYGVTAIVFVVSIPFVWVRFGGAYGLLMAANLWLPLSSGVFEGLGRYCSVLFPFFIWAGVSRSRTLFAALVVVSIVLYPIALGMFVTLRPLF